jgi:hypothetical protein
MKLHKLGGCAAFASILAVILIGFYEFRIYQFGDLNYPVKAMAAVLGAPNIFIVFNLLILFASILDLVFNLALHERMQADGPYLTRAMLIAASSATVMAVAYTMIALANIRLIHKTQDVSAYTTWDMINAGLNNACSFAGGWASLFAGCAILRTRAFSRILGGLGILNGLIGIPIFIVPQLSAIGVLPGFIAKAWIGIALFRQKQHKAEANALK